MFLPAIAVAVYRYYLVEASVYTYTMFFSTVGIAFCRVPCQLPLSIKDAASDSSPWWTSPSWSSNRSF